MCRSGLLRGSPQGRGNPRSRAWRSHLPCTSASSAPLSPSLCKYPRGTPGRPPRQRIRKDSPQPMRVPEPRAAQLPLREPGPMQVPVFSVVAPQAPQRVSPVPTGVVTIALKPSAVLRLSKRRSVASHTLNCFQEQTTHIHLAGVLMKKGNRR